MYMLAGKAKQRLVLQITTGENLAEKADECPLIRVVKYCLHTIGAQKVSIILKNRVSTVQGLTKGLLKY